VVAPNEKVDNASVLQAWAVGGAAQQASAKQGLLLCSRTVPLDPKV
jgi:hypothetical protein